jgi:hypothetical protein
MTGGGRTLKTSGEDVITPFVLKDKHIFSE